MANTVKDTDPIEIYNPPVRVLNCTKRNGLFTLGDVKQALDNKRYLDFPTLRDDMNFFIFWQDRL